MTTTVKVTAHCDPETTQVEVKRTGDPDTAIQDGESLDVVVYDDITVSVKEVPKTA